MPISLTSDQHRDNYLNLIKFEQRLFDSGRYKIAAFVRKQALIQLEKMADAQGRFANA